ncbi:hypothetical protein ACJMK2_018775 [Sinanodonta woodiana]|uniref:TNF family profile domain-containing protein n=1 Tax=Sinanodonta woodiana TaxID=1069815 RepID=A0ABD3UEE4_SINWO
MIENCLSENSVEVPVSFKPSTSNILEQIVSPSLAPVCDQPFLRTRIHILIQTCCHNLVQSYQLLRNCRLDNETTHSSSMGLLNDRLSVTDHVGLTINYNSNEDTVNEKQALHHNISRYNPIYLNVKLNKGDQLYIIVSQVFISNDPKLTYFGAYNIY